MNHLKKIPTCFLCLFSILLFACCKPSKVSDPRTYLVMLADEKNGLTTHKSVAGILYKLKYLPADYLAYSSLNRFGRINTALKDSAKRSFEHSLTFLLNIGPVNEKDGDITRIGVSGYGDFAERIEKMAFGAQNWISIKTNDKVHKPSIVRLENLNAMEYSRNFLVVFESGSEESDLKKSDLCFSYTDEIFNTGTNNFIFKAADIANFPALDF